MKIMFSKIDDYFNITKSGSTIKREVIGGITAFLSMSFIIFVNPIVLGDAGMDVDAVFAATILSAAIATLIMGLHGKFPLGLASCMNMNAFFAYSIVRDGGFSWQEGLACVLLSSLLFFALSVSGMRVKLLKAMPKELKSAGSVGLGMFIFFVGLRNSELIVFDKDLLVKMGNFTNPSVIIALVGVFTLSILLVKHSRYAVVYAMLASLVTGLFIAFLASNNILNYDSATLAKLPHLSERSFVLPHVPIKAMIDETLFVAVFNIPKVLTFSGLGAILTLTFLDFLGTTETLNAASNELKRYGVKTDNKEIYIVDSIGTFVGSLLGTSNVSTYTESVSGVVSGSRTGLMSVVVAILFLLSFFLYPFITLFTTSITSPALIAIGIFMFKNVVDIDWSQNFENTIPAFFIIALMPLTGSVALGLALGFILYTSLMVVAKRSKEIHPYMYFINIVSLLYVASKCF